MKGKYLLFAYMGFYPDGGANDYKFCFDSKEELEDGLNNFLDHDYDFYNVFNCEDKEFICTESQKLLLYWAENNLV